MKGGHNDGNENLRFHRRSARNYNVKQSATKCMKSNYERRGNVAVHHTKRTFICTFMYVHYD